MISFKTYLSEQFSRGSGILHLERMKPLEFIELMKDLSKVKKLKFPEVKITEKIDGFALTVGIDDSGKLFVQTARSPKIYDASEFVKFAKEKGRNLEIAQAYHDLTNYLFNHKKLTAVLRKYYQKAGRGFGVRGEALWNQLAKEVEENKLQFVAIRYDKSRLGKKLTFVIIGVFYLDGTEFNFKDELIKDLKSISDSEIKILTPEINFSEINIEVVVNDFEKMMKDYPDIERILKSRSKKDREIKEVLISLIDQMKAQLAKIILQNVKAGILGPEYEGIVLDIKGKKYKIQSDVFKKLKFGK